MARQLARPVWQSGSKRQVNSGLLAGRPKHPLKLIFIIRGVARRDSSPALFLCEVLPCKAMSFIVRPFGLTAWSKTKGVIRMPWWGWAIAAYVVLVIAKTIVRAKRKQKQEAQKKFTDEG